MEIIKMGAEWTDRACEILECSRSVFPRLDMDGFRLGLQRNIRRGTALCAVEDGVMTGFVVFSPPLSKISFLLVDEKFRRHGTGELLLKSAVNALDRGTIFVETYFNEPCAESARRLYHRFGFRDAELLDGYEIPEIRMVLER